MKTIPTCVKIVRWLVSLYFTSQGAVRQAFCRWYFFRNFPAWYVQNIAIEAKEALPTETNKDAAIFYNEAINEWQLVKARRNRNRLTK